MVGSELILIILMYSLDQSNADVAVTIRKSNHSLPLLLISALPIVYWSSFS